jgi:D-beta-D-heptose 7-phosphate kinase/D-beta-D-heptose 1-phosphate adenosyltransferase
MLIDIRSQKDKDIVNLCGAHKHPIIGLTSGCFDLFHHLHLAYLQKCRRLCDVLVVGVDSDDFVRKTKGPARPVISEHQRVMILNALECVDVTFIMGSLKDWEIACGTFHPSVLFKNSRFDPKEVINPFRAEVVIVPDVMSFDSTSHIIAEIARNGNTVATK